MRGAKVLLVVAMLAVPAMADYYVAGDFNGWNAAGNLMTEVSPGKWSTTITNAPGVHEFKVTIGDWASNWPGDNAKADFGAGSLTINFYPTPAADGWFPTANRVGYDDIAVHGWDVMGSFNGWSSPVALNPMGNGLYAASYTVADPGTFYFKFRKAGDWNVAVGNDFSNYGHDIAWTTTVPNQVVYFQLDLPNGRWNVPEPTTLALLCGGLVCLRRRRA
jgi:hypothetical protein